MKKFDKYVIQSLINDKKYEELCNKHKEIMDKGGDISKIDEALCDYFKIIELEAAANERASFLERMCGIFFKRKN